MILKRYSNLDSTESTCLASTGTRFYPQHSKEEEEAAEEEMVLTMMMY